MEIATGFIYRRKPGSIVRKTEVGGISCESSARTKAITGDEVSCWKVGPLCLDATDGICAGEYDNKLKFYKWELPIKEVVRTEANIEDTWTFQARPSPNKCDQAHCSIAIHRNGVEVTDYDGIGQENRGFINEHLKVESGEVTCAADTETRTKP